MTRIELTLIQRFLEAPFGSLEMLDALADLIGLYDDRTSGSEK